MKNLTEKQIISLFDEGKGYQLIRRMAGYPEETWEQVNWGLSMWSFDVPQGSYFVRVALFDDGSNRWTEILRVQNNHSFDERWGKTLRTDYGWWESVKIA